METDVRERADLAAVVAHDEDGLARDLEGEVVAPPGNGVGAARADPLLREDPAEFPFQEPFRGIDGGRRGPRLLEGQLGIGLEFFDEGVE